MTIVGLATDPSTADFFAGFTHNRNCGDGATGDATNPSHPYGTAGNYTLLAMAIDNDRGSSAQTTTSIVIATATVIPIDATWLQINGPARYVPARPARPTNSKRTSRRAALLSLS